jgi:fucose permease
MYYVIVFLALIVVIAVLIVLRTVASYPQRDEAEQVEQSETLATYTNLAQNTPAVAGEHENASLSEEKFSG